MASGVSGGGGSVGAGNVGETGAGPEDNTKVAALRSQVNEVKDVMSKNIEKVMERGDNLDNLVTKTTDLEAGAAVFRDQTKVVRRKMWWKNTKMNLILGIVAIVIIVIIILSTVNWNSSNSDTSSTGTTDSPGKGQ